MRVDNTRSLLSSTWAGKLINRHSFLYFYFYSDLRMNQWLCIYVCSHYVLTDKLLDLYSMLLFDRLLDSWSSESIFFQEVIDIVNSLLVSVVIIGMASIIAIALSCVIWIVIVVIVSGVIMMAASVDIKMRGFRIKVVFLVVGERLGLGRAGRRCLKLWNVRCGAMVSRRRRVLLATHGLSLQKLALEDLVLCIQWRFLLPKSSELLWQLPDLLPTLLQFRPDSPQILVLVVHLLPFFIHVIVLLVQIISGEGTSSLRLPLLHLHFDLGVRASKIEKHDGEECEHEHINVKNMVQNMRCPMLIIFRAHLRGCWRELLIESA